jgi:archaellum component FlaC
LYRITRSVNKIELDIKDLTHQIKPLIASATNLSEKLNFISDEAKQPIIIVKEVVEDIKDRINVILEFEEKLIQGVNGPLTKLLNSISGISNGINAFWNNYKRRL